MVPAPWKPHLEASRRDSAVGVPLVSALLTARPSSGPRGASSEHNNCTIGKNGEMGDSGPRCCIGHLQWDYYQSTEEQGTVGTAGKLVDLAVLHGSPPLPAPAVNSQPCPATQLLASLSLRPLGILNGCSGTKK